MGCDLRYIAFEILGWYVHMEWNVIRDINKNWYCCCMHVMERHTRYQEELVLPLICWDGMNAWNGT